MARRMQSSVRPYDAVGRYGGEEFLIVLPGCDGRSAEAQAERMRLEIQRAPVELPEGNLAVTASFGATALERNCTRGGAALIQTADTALYDAKIQGRNRVVCLPCR